MIVVIVLSVVYVIKRGMGVAKQIEHVSKQISDKVDTCTLDEEVEEFQPVYTRPLQETTRKYAQRQTVRYELRNLKRLKHEQKWAQWNNVNKLLIFHEL